MKNKFCFQDSRFQQNQSKFCTTALTSEITRVLCVWRYENKDVKLFSLGALCDKATSASSLVDLQDLDKAGTGENQNSSYSCNDFV